MTMVAPFAAGGSTDAIARIVADGLSSQLHQPVIVENIAGAGGMTGTNRVARAVPDGYQFVLGNVGTHAQNQSLYKKPLYDAMTDFAPVALITDQSLVLVARNDFPANNLQEFIAYAKANQSKLRYSSAGVGGSNHLACVLEPFAEHSGLAVSARTGADRLRHPELVYALPAEGYAGRDSAEASQCHGRHHGHAVDARTAQ